MASTSKKIILSSDLGFEQSLKMGKFTITTEFLTVRGINIEMVIENAKILKKLTNGVNVGDLQRSQLYLSSLATCHILKDLGLDPIMQITCRDKNRLALQSELLSAHVLGIRNILVLTGDHPAIGDQPQTKPVFDLDSVQLLWVIKKLESGYDMAGNLLNGKPDFFKGAVINPNADTDASIELQLIKMVKKIEQGAQFFQTQPVFNINLFEKFIERVSKLSIKIPIIAGIMLIKSENMAAYINKFIPGIKIPEAIIEKMAKSKDKISKSIEIATDIVKKIKPLCSGIHIGAQGWENHLEKFINNLN